MMLQAITGLVRLNIESRPLVRRATRASRLISLIMKSFRKLSAPLQWAAFRSTLDVPGRGPLMSLKATASPAPPLGEPVTHGPPQCIARGSTAGIAKSRPMTVWAKK